MQNTQHLVPRSILPSLSLVLLGQRIVYRTQLLPLHRHRVAHPRPGHVLGEHDRKARVEVEVNVAVEEPRARVVGLRAVISRSNWMPVRLRDCLLRNGR